LMQGPRPAANLAAGQCLRPAPTGRDRRQSQGARAPASRGPAEAWPATVRAAAPHRQLLGLVCDVLYGI
jgi:hypothetical protein